MLIFRASVGVFLNYFTHKISYSYNSGFDITGFEGYELLDKQAGADLGQAQAKFELLMKFKLTLQLEFTTSPGGWWVLDFTKLMQSHLPTKVAVEVEDELGKNRIKRKLAILG